MEKLVFKSVCLGYTKDINAVDDASFSIKKGDFASIIGDGVPQELQALVVVDPG